VVAWNEWRRENPELDPDLIRADFIGEDLRGADLSRAHLNWADLRRTNLEGGNLKGAYLQWANLRRANLEAVDLERANLRGADLRGASFAGANFAGAILAEAHLEEANLTGANFASCKVAHTIFAAVDLSKVKGLTAVDHWGPSSIGIDTIYRSNGEIPGEFLRGAGVPDDLIEHAHSIAGATPFYSCFIRYSSSDQEFARRLHADLQSKGIRCWFAPEDVWTGDTIRARIDESIRIYDKIVIVLSENSIQSHWIEQEVETALAMEREQNKAVLFPIRVDNTVMMVKTGWPALIRKTRHIGDFTSWKDHDSYLKAFVRLLRDLRAKRARRWGKGGRRWSPESRPEDDRDRYY
jgi:uncharacterized protein YjbI with pentapeptide repeats